MTIMYTVWINIEGVDNETEESEENDPRYFSQDLTLKEAQDLADEIADKFPDLTCGHSTLITEKQVKTHITKSDAEFLVYWLKQLFPENWTAQQYRTKNQWCVSMPYTPANHDNFREYVGAAQALLAIQNQLQEKTSNA